MLVAYGPDGQTVVAEETPLPQLQEWSHDRQLFCPNCRANVHVRGGPEKRTQLHFAHQRGECAWSTETESVRHARGKVVLANWLRTQYPEATVTLEERLPEPNRIADVFVRHADGHGWAVEYQCAPLEIAEWRHRHEAYRKAGILDTWIIGNNRREKQEAFIEAVLSTSHEILFLDPQTAPPRVWLRWPVTRQQVDEWQRTTTSAARNFNTPTLDGWVGRAGYGATLLSTLPEIRLDPQAHLLHPARTALEQRRRLLHTMSNAARPEETHLRAYLQRSVDERTLSTVLLPLLRAYLRDPDLLRRYNYGRGLNQSPPTSDDLTRVSNARSWLQKLSTHGYPPARLQEIIPLLPFVGPYAAFTTYLEMLLAISQHSQ